jgi:threonine synthase
LSGWPGVIGAYREYIDLPAGAEPVTLLEGNTPLVPVSGILPDDIDLYVKVEGLNPTGSFKDRGMTVAVTAAKAAGARLVICASTGNTSASAAAYAARAGMACLVLVPAGHVARGKLAQAYAHGAEVVSIDGNFDAGLAVVRELAAQHREFALVNSVNPYRLEGQKTAAYEVAAVLGRSPSHLVLPVGNAGNITAYAMGFRDLLARGQVERLPVLVGVQAEGAAPIVRGEPVAEPETIATAIRIGRPASWQKAVTAVAESGGHFRAVSDAEILEAYRLLASRVGIFAEPASAAAVAGVLALARDGQLRSGDVVVAVLTGHGLKDPETALRDVEVRTVPATTDSVLSLAWETAARC